MCYLFISRRIICSKLRSAINYAMLEKNTTFCYQPPPLPSPSYQAGVWFLRLYLTRSWNYRPKHYTLQLQTQQNKNNVTQFCDTSSICWLHVWTKKVELRCKLILSLPEIYSAFNWYIKFRSNDRQCRILTRIRWQQFFHLFHNNYRCATN